MNLEEIYNIHKGQTAFIAGSSPSLRFIEEKQINKGIIFSVNSAILKFPNSNYFVTDDWAVTTWNYWYTHVINKNIIKLLYREKLSKYVNNDNLNNTIFYDHRFWSKIENNKVIYDLKDLIMYSDPLVPIIGARTSIASAINLAFICGCSPIVLIGCDCCYENQYKYFWQFPNQTLATKINGTSSLFLQEGFVSGKVVDKHCVDTLRYWNHFAEANKDKIENILYCSENGIVDVFKRCKISEVT